MDWQTSIYIIEYFLDRVESFIWGLPLVISLMGLGFVFSIKLKGIQIRGFFHAFQVIIGKYNSKNAIGETTPFQAFTTVLGSTTGLGNIAGVPVAIQISGPSSVLWMILFGIVAMAIRYSECTLALIYRRREGAITLSGPMYYIEYGLGASWRVLAIIFAISCLFNSLVAGNLFQINQMASILHASYAIPQILTGCVVAFLVGIVIIGGVKRIGLVTSYMVPIVCGVYVVACCLAILTHFHQMPYLIKQIVLEAFTGTAAIGGLAGTAIAESLKQGVQRACFLSETGNGVAGFIHGAAKTAEPVRQGLVALLEPFINIIVMCSFTALVVLISGAWTSPHLTGVNITATAFDFVLPGFGTIGLPIVVAFLAYSCLLAGFYYGEIAISFLARGKNSENQTKQSQWILIYKIVFCLNIVLGAIWSFTPILHLTDIVFGIMLIANLIAVYLLFPQVQKATEDYFQRLNKGEFK